MYVYNYKGVGWGRMGDIIIFINYYDIIGFLVVKLIYLVLRYRFLVILWYMKVRYIKIYFFLVEIKDWIGFGVNIMIVWIFKFFYMCSRI